jgi:hypothetical protein
VVSALPRHHERPVRFAVIHPLRLKEEKTMAFAGIVVTLVGFLVAAVSPGLMTGTSGRLVMVLAGIAISLFGILGMLNPAFRKNAIWRR